MTQSSPDITHAATAERCVFCDLIESGTLRDFGSVVAFPDAYPVTTGHYLIVPRRHVLDYFDMLPEEKQDTDRAIAELHHELLVADSRISGFNVGTNVGEAAGQTIAHAHIHLIPRRFGDTPNPRGGVRGVVPERMQY